MIALRRCALALALGVLVARPAAGEKLPDWLEAARATASLSATADVHAQVLLHEVHVVLPAKGRVRTHERGVVRILDAKGAAEASVSVPYDRTSARVTAIRGWAFDAEGVAKSLGKKDVFDQQLESAGTFQTDLRQMTLFVSDAEPGSVFAWEFEVEEEALFADQRMWIGAGLPCALERIELELPPNVSPKFVATGGTLPEPVRVGNVWRWELRDLPGTPGEPWSAPPAAWHDGLVLEPRAANGSPGVAGAAFADWGEASRWLDAISEPSVVPSPAIVARAQALAAGATTPIEKARALGRFVQSLNYLSVSIGLAHGEGYRPHRAEDVLRVGYGDCKDKAALFCSLARALGMEAWLASASTLGRDAVRREWPLPSQFNHCIAALRVPAGTSFGGVTADAALGPLLFFDPTDPSTPFGTLPGYLYGSWVLLLHPQKGELLRMPTPAVHAPLSESHLEATVEESGALRGHWSLVTRGRVAQVLRAQLQGSSTSWQEGVERQLVAWLGPCQLSGLEAKDLPDSDACRVSADVTAPRYGKAIGGRLMALPVASRLEETWRSRRLTRMTPIELPLGEWLQEVTLTLPAGWTIAERPSDISREYDFGRLSSTWTASSNAVRLQFRVHLEPVTLPPARYGDWTLLLGDWARASRAQVVVARP